MPPPTLASVPAFNAIPFHYTLYLMPCFHCRRETKANLECQHLLIIIDSCAFMRAPIGDGRLSWLGPGGGETEQISPAGGCDSWAGDE